MNRRAFVSTACSAVAAAAMSEEDQSTRSIGVPLVQEPLAFDFDELEPFMDAGTLRPHYEKVHAEYLTSLLKTLKGVNLEVASLSNLLPVIKSVPMPPSNSSVIKLGTRPGPLPENVQEDIRKFGGGHQCHTTFWRFLAAPGKGPSGPEGNVAQALQTTFGSIADFKRSFTDAALAHAGQGWAWLIYRADKKFVITTTSGNDHPRMKDYLPADQVGRPILCLDLWDHSHSPKFNGDREKYITAWWNVVNWSFMSRAYGIVTNGPPV